MVVEQVDSIHFRNISHVVDENGAVRKVIALRRQLRDSNAQSTAFHFSNVGVSYAWVSVSMGLGWLISLGTFIYWAYKAEGRTKERHAQMIATVVDREYGERIYQTLERRRSGTRQATFQVNVGHAIPLVPVDTPPNSPGTRA